MAEAFVGEIRLFGITYEPYRWFACKGQDLWINQYTALYAIIGTMYGGDGRHKFGLPDFRGRAPRGHGQGPGTPDIPIGLSDGVAKVKLNLEQMPSHNHDLIGDDRAPDDGGPNGQSMLGTFTGGPFAYAEDGPVSSMHQDMLKVTGAGEAHENWQPYLALQFFICEDGIFPSRN